MEIARARIRCAESGHMWEDAFWYKRPATPSSGLKEVWERTQACVRPGCERTRKDRVRPRTFALLSRTYGGRLEKIGRVTRETMRKEIIGK
jgi:hypothetical protein